MSRYVNPQTAGSDVDCVNLKTVQKLMSGALGGFLETRNSQPHCPGCQKADKHGMGTVNVWKTLRTSISLQVQTSRLSLGWKVGRLHNSDG